MFPPSTCKQRRGGGGREGYNFSMRSKETKLGKGGGGHPGTPLWGKHCVHACSHVRITVWAESLDPREDILVTLKYIQEPGKWE